MFDRRRWAGHGRAIALAFAVAFLGLASRGYDPRRSPGSGRELPNDPPANPCADRSGRTWRISCSRRSGRLPTSSSTPRRSGPGSSPAVARWSTRRSACWASR